MSGFLVVVGVLIAIATVGFSAGMISSRYRWAPWFVTMAIVIGLVAVNVGYGVWAEQCIDCRATYDSTRGNVWAGVAYLSVLAALCLITIVWLGALMSALARSAVLWVRWARADGETKTSLEAGRR